MSINIKMMQSFYHSINCSNIKLKVGSFYGLTSNRKFHHLPPSNILKLKCKININNLEENFIKPEFFLNTHRRLFCSSTSNICWNCGSQSLAFEEFCSKCNFIQRLQDVDHFTRLKMCKKFNIDMKQTRNDFRKLQSYFHPDKFTLKSQEEQKLASDYSTAINNAYQTLLHPIKRAEYLLQLEGQSLSEGEISLDSLFLMEIMEINENLQDADDKRAVEAIGVKNQNIIDSLLKEADEAFTSGNIVLARNIVAKLKYYNNIYEKIVDYERKHGIVD